MELCVLPLLLVGAAKEDWPIANNIQKVYERGRIMDSQCRCPKSRVVEGNRQAIIAHQRIAAHHLSNISQGMILV